MRFFPFDFEDGMRDLIALKFLIIACFFFLFFFFSFLKRDLDIKDIL